MDGGQKELLVSVVVPVRDPSQRPPAPNVESVKSVANDEGDKEMIPEAVYRSPGIFLMADENPGKSQLGDRGTTYFLTLAFI